MQIEFTENEHGIYFNVKPETVKEAAQLMRYAANKSNEKAQVHFSFSNNEPYCDITLRKVLGRNQKNYINKDLK